MSIKLDKETITHHLNQNYQSTIDDLYGNSNDDAFMGELLQKSTKPHCNPKPITNVCTQSADPNCHRAQLLLDHRFFQHYLPITKPVKSSVQSSIVLLPKVEHTDEKKIKEQLSVAISNKTQDLNTDPLPAAQTPPVTPAPIPPKAKSAPKSFFEGLSNLWASLMSFLSSWVSK